ncbi:hypothetical protein KA005_39375, partial [bacterium]|nr:hypothetical protein [bacterium]
ALHGAGIGNGHDGGRSREGNYGGIKVPEIGFPQIIQVRKYKIAIIIVTVYELKVIRVVRFLSYF